MAQPAETVQLPCPRLVRRRYRKRRRAPQLRGETAEAKAVRSRFHRRSLDLAAADREAPAAGRRPPARGASSAAAANVACARACRAAPARWPAPPVRAFRAPLPWTGRPARTVADAPLSPRDSPARCWGMSMNPLSCRLWLRQDGSRQRGVRGLWTSRSRESLQPRHIEPIDARQLRRFQLQVAGQRSQIASRRDPGLGRRPVLAAAIGTRLKSGLLPRKAAIWCSPSSGSSEQVL